MFQGNRKWVLFALALVLVIGAVACTTPPTDTAVKACLDKNWVPTTSKDGAVTCNPPAATQTTNNASTQSANTSTQSANTSTQSVTTQTGTSQSGDPDLATKLLAMPLPQAQQWLAQNIGGDATHWGYAGLNVWTYSWKDHMASFKHWGKRTILTYWKDFPEPTGDTRQCWIQIPPKGGVNDGTTRFVQCPEGTGTGASTATFSADGVGFHVTPNIP